MSIYYVYAYLRSKDSKTAKAGTPYYVGMGKGNRAYEKHRVPVPTDKNLIVFLETNLGHLGALALERRMISWWGRADQKMGILRNLTDGGEGNVGYKHSAETRRKISESQIGKIISKETRAKLSLAGIGNTLSTSIRKKISVSCQGRIVTDEGRANMSNAQKGKLVSEETRHKLSTAGINRHCSVETRSKLSSAAKGRKHSEEAKQRMRDAIANRKKLSQCACMSDDIEIQRRSKL